MRVFFNEVEVVTTQTRDTREAAQHLTVKITLHSCLNALQSASKLRYILISGRALMVKNNYAEKLQKI